MGVPAEIPELGPVSQQLRQNPQFDPTKSSFTSEDYFVWSRVDGQSSLRELILMTGFPTEKTVDILRKLRSAGAVLLPDETPETVAVSATPGATSGAPREKPAVPTAPDEGLDPASLTDGERAALAEDVALSEAERQRVIAFLRKVDSGDYFALLGVDRDTDKRALKRAYFKLSKSFHPDRYYGKVTGSFGPWLARIFGAVNEAFEVLSDDTRRGRYLTSLDGQAEAGAAGRPQTKAEHAASLFDRACGAEVRGDTTEALPLFAAAIRVHPEAPASYYRRAASCATVAKKFQDAVEYAKKAAILKGDDPSYARALAHAYEAAGMLEDAQQALVAALSLRTENDKLEAEIKADLEQVRRKLAT